MNHLPVTACRTSGALTNSYACYCLQDKRGMVFQPEAPPSIASSNSSEEEAEVEVVEMLLQVYFMLLHNTCNKLQVRGYRAAGRLLLADWLGGLVT